MKPSPTFQIPTATYVLPTPTPDNKSQDVLLSDFLTYYENIGFQFVPMKDLDNIDCLYGSNNNQTIEIIVHEDNGIISDAMMSVHFVEINDGKVANQYLYDFSSILTHNGWWDKGLRNLFSVNSSQKYP